MTFYFALYPIRNSYQTDGVTSQFLTFPIDSIFYHNVIFLSDNKE